ncbi:MAG: Zn-dependent exopeptidase M28 [Bacteroidales bacterium]|nr:Zn-dependent exopeptidase M28 [Bacteroidales bacterium]
MKRFWMVMACALTLVGCTDYRAYYNGLLEEISSDRYNGRSVYGDGDVRAARYLIDQLSAIEGVVPCPAAGPEDASVQPYLKSLVEPADAGRWNVVEDKEKYLPWLQHFQFPMNVMRGAMSLSVDGVAYAPTFDFTVKEFSPSCHGFFKVTHLDEEAYRREGFMEHLSSGIYRDQFVVIDWERYLETIQPDPFDKYKPWLTELDNIGGILLQQEEQFPYFKARTYYQSKHPVLFVNESFPDDAREIELHVDAEMLPTRDAHNVVAWLPGTDPKADTYYTFIAHYDHLGYMGADFMFPGANDNGSGSAMLVTLAKYFSKHRPAHGVQFILLDAEEENLLGGFFYCENPRLPLDKIEYLIDLDMVGDDSDHLSTQITPGGEAGLERFRAINADGKFPPFDFVMEEMNDDSDHFSFAQKGVPGIYFETEGSILQYYHTPRDNFQNTRDSNFDRLFHLITEFVK